MRHLRYPACVVGLASLPLVAAVTGCAPRVEPADMVLNSGKIVTVDREKPEAQAVAIRGDTIVGVGTNDELKPYIGEKTEVIDLAGKLAIPGFIDSHLHFTGVGEMKMQLDLTKAKSWEDMSQWSQRLRRRRGPAS